jgi:excisionase family DNA binding protein
MHEEDLLTLDQAAELSGLGKATLREMVRSGRLPAVRREGRWSIARADLAWLPLVAPRGGSAKARKGAPEPDQSASAPASSQLRSEVLAMIDLVRERDAQIADLQDERVRLAGQVGFLQGQLGEREERVRMLEAALLGIQEGRVARDAMAKLSTGWTAVTVEAEPAGPARTPIPIAGGPAPEPAQHDTVPAPVQNDHAVAPSPSNEHAGNPAATVSAGLDTSRASVPAAEAPDGPADDPPAQPRKGGLLASISRFLGLSD